jgi:hypothetical protein
MGFSGREIRLSIYPKEIAKIEKRKRYFEQALEEWTNKPDGK